MSKQTPKRWEQKVNAMDEEQKARFAGALFLVWQKLFAEPQTDSTTKQLPPVQNGGAA